MFEKIVDTVAIDMSEGLCIKAVDSKKNNDRFILDLGKVMYGNYYPMALVFVNKKFVGLYRDLISSLLKI